MKRETWILLETCRSWIGDAEEVNDKTNRTRRVPHRRRVRYTKEEDDIRRNSSIIATTSNKPDGRESNE